ncbi:MAG: hypothetical protein HKN76_14690, partial [Saprospiraceae bacterium]|nr:hypothetical protein [Saprospiraceae bacterium]
MKPFISSDHLYQKIPVGICWSSLLVYCLVGLMIQGFHNESFCSAPERGPLHLITILEDPISCPESVTISADSHTQEEINNKFESWINQFSINPECDSPPIFRVGGKVIDIADLEAPDACGGAVILEMEIQAECGNALCQSDFIVEPSSSEIAISLPIYDFTCFNTGAPPTYEFLPPKNLTRILALSIYSPCIDLQSLKLEIEEPAPVINGTEYHFNRKYILSNDQGIYSIGVETFSITYDVTPPILLGIPDDLILTCGTELPEWPEVQAFDGENELEITRTEKAHFTHCGGRYFTRIWMAIDDCGNTAEHTQRIHFEDSDPPWIEVPADTIIDCNGDIPVPTYEAGDQGCS